MIKCFLNFEHAVGGTFPVIKSSVRFCLSVNREIENIKVRKEDFNRLGFLKINTIN